MLRRNSTIALFVVLGACALAVACGSSKGTSAVLDKDKDGVADDLGVGIDADGDGKLDTYKKGVAVDTNDDGKPDAAGLDTDGDGVVDALDTNGDGKPDKTTKLDTPGGSAGHGGGAGTGGSSSGGSAGGIIIPSGGSSGGGASAEICDGIDNDGNGIIDDVDVGGDGICDCLRIGTIGTIGPWSTGGDIFKAWLNARTPVPATELGDETLTAENLGKLDVIVVLRADTAPLAEDSTPAHHAFTDAEVQAFSEWVQAGGGVMTTIGYQGDETAEIVNVNSLLAPLGMGYSSDTSLDGFVTNWQTHAISDGVTNIRINNGCTVDDTQGTVVAYGTGDKPAMVVSEAGKGKVIVWGDEWITYDSEWANTTDQQVERLWLNMFKWLTPITQCQVVIPPIIK